MLTVPPSVQSWLTHHGFGTLVNSQPIGGGCISEAYRLSLSDGKQLFLKYNPSVPSGFFDAEAAGLQALTVTDGPIIPQVHHHASQWILMEWLEPGHTQPKYWEQLGHQLATLHNTTHSDFGFPCDTFCGATRQPNHRTNDGHTFYAEHRFGYQAQLAKRHGLITSEEVRMIEAFAQRLRKLIPIQPPSLIHGDLWSGNVHRNADGQPALIDPATYFGWAEADLAMTCLFGAFPDPFYAAYENNRPCINDHGNWRQRADIHNCYHLLNHANLFGGGHYLDQAMAIVRRYGSSTT